MQEQMKNPEVQAQVQEMASVMKNPKFLAKMEELKVSAHVASEAQSFLGMGCNARPIK